VALLLVKMCDGWPAGPAPSRFYTTPAGTDADFIPAVHLLGAASPSRYTPTLAAVRERARRDVGISSGSEGRGVGGGIDLA
jgi:hypothetical protein